MEVTQVSVGNTELSPHNMNFKKPVRHIGGLIANIEANGVLTPLHATTDGDKYYIVAGRRRRAAALAIAEKGGKDVEIPVVIVPDDENAVLVSVAENLEREDLSETERCAAYVQLLKAGHSEQAICDQYGVKIADMRRSLAIGQIDKRILALYDSEDLTGNELQAFTLATKKQQGEWMKLHNDNTHGAPRFEQLRKWIAGGGEYRMDNAIFDLTDYKGGTKLDLFADESSAAAIAADAEEWMTLQKEAVDKIAARYRESGWEVEILNHKPPSWKYEKRAKKDGGRVILSLLPNGEFMETKGIAKIAESSTGSAEAKGKKTRPEVSAKAQDIINDYQLLLARYWCAVYPHKAATVALAHVLAGNTESTPPIAADWVHNAEMHERHKKAIEFAQSLCDGEHVDWISVPDAHNTGSLAGFIDVGMLTDRIITMNIAQEDFEIVLAAWLAGNLSPTHSGVAIALAQLAEDETDGDDLPKPWLEDGVDFFGAVTHGDVLDAMLEELMGEDAAAEQAKTNKAKRVKLAELAKADPEWTPKWFQLPARQYLSE